MEENCLKKYRKSYYKKRLSQSWCASFGAELFPWASKCQQKAKQMRVRICRLKTPDNPKQKLWEKKMRRAFLDDARNGCDLKFYECGNHKMGNFSFALFQV